MTRQRKATDDRALLRLLDLVGGDLKELNRWARALLKHGRQKRGRKKYRDRISIGTYERLLGLQGRERTEAIRELVRDGRIRGTGAEASTVKRFSREFRHFEKNVVRMVNQFRDFFRATN